MSNSCRRQKEKLDKVIGLDSKRLALKHFQPQLDYPYAYTRAGKYQS